MKSHNYIFGCLQVASCAILSVFILSTNTNAMQVDKPKIVINAQMIQKDYDSAAVKLIYWKDRDEWKEYSAWRSGPYGEHEEKDVRIELNSEDLKNVVEKSVPNGLYEIRFNGHSPKNNWGIGCHNSNSEDGLFELNGGVIAINAVVSMPYDLKPMSELPSDGMPKEGKIYIGRVENGEIKYVIKEKWSQDNGKREGKIEIPGLPQDSEISEEVLSKNGMFILNALKNEGVIIPHLDCDGVVMDS